MNRLNTLRDIRNMAPQQAGWYRIVNAAPGTGVTSVWIYGFIGWDVTAQEFVKDLNDVRADAIDVHLATDGGDVFEGVAIMNALRAHPAYITTIVDSQALSAGSFILQGGDTRKVARNGTVMVHDAHGGVFGNPRDVAAHAALLEQASDNIASMYVDRAGGTVAAWRAVMAAETWYTAEGAVEAGLADEVIDFSPRPQSDATQAVAVRDKIASGVHTVDAPAEQPNQPETSFADLFRAALQEVS